MIGLVLAAGAGRRLRPHTDTIPKTLLSVGDDTTVLDVILGNLAAVGLTDAALVIGYAADAVRDRKRELEARHQLTLELIPNDFAEERNNCYSLWCARETFSAGVLIVNGDTVHPRSVEDALLHTTPVGELTLALDTVKTLAEEEMKVVLDGDGHLLRISKLLEPATSDGEYIGVTRLDPTTTDDVAEALHETWQRDDSLYYEDGFQTYVDAGGRIGVCPIGSVDWVEVDNADDLARAREIVCRY
jgi:choline kinase